MKKRPTELSREEKIRTLDTLYTALSAVRGRDAMKLFLRDLLTESERIMLGRRIWIARLLIAGEEYDAIGEKLHVGYGTIARVAHWLDDQFPGYEQAVREMEKQLDTRAVRAEIKKEPFSYAALKRKYPLHFLLFPKPTPKKKYRQL